MVKAAGRTGRLPEREVLISLGLFLALIVVVLVARRSPAPSDNTPYGLDSVSRQGLLALHLWLEELGYQVTTNGDQTFQVPQEADLLFIYPGDKPFTTNEAAEVRRWVASGHTLVVVAPGMFEGPLTREFGITSGIIPVPVGASRQQQPLLPAAPAALGSNSVTGPLTLQQAPQAIPVLVADSDHVMATVQPEGQGTVWHLSARHNLVNANLKDGQGGHIVLALLRTVPAGGTVVFETYHRSISADAATLGAPETLRDWLYRAPAGWGILFGVVVLFAGWVLQGVRLGPALPAPEEIHRREAAEHVTAMAALQRRARQRQAVARHHKARLKAALGRRMRLSPDLPDAEFLRRWRGLDDQADAGREAALRLLLASLSAEPDEETLVRLVAQVDDVIAGL